MNSRPYVRGCAGNRNPPGENSALYFLLVRFLDQAVADHLAPSIPARRFNSDTGSRTVRFAGSHHVGPSFCQSTRTLPATSPAIGWRYSVPRLIVYFVTSGA